MLTRTTQAIASLARDLILFGVLTSLAAGATIACCLFNYGAGVGTRIKIAAYFWIVSSILAWWRVTAFLVQEGFGSGFGRGVGSLGCSRLLPCRRR